jgi:hypothetical protein
MALYSNEQTETRGDHWFDQIKVLDVNNISGTPAQEGWQPNDCSLVVTFCLLDEDGNVSDPESEPWTMFVMGNYRRNTQGKIEDWGGAFKVRTFLEACGLSGQFTDNDGNLDMKVVNNCINKIVWKVSYKSTEVSNEGRNKIKTWSGRLFADLNNAKKAFAKSQKTGWPRDYLGLPGNQVFEGRNPDAEPENASDAAPTQTQFPSDL